MAEQDLDWDEVKSSNISKVTWVVDEDEESDIGDGWMYIVFNSGWMYVYFDVPAHVYDAFMDAPSKGKYHHQNIKWKYDYQRLAKV